MLIIFEFKLYRLIYRVSGGGIMGGLIRNSLMFKFGKMLRGIFCGLKIYSIDYVYGVCDMF